MHAFTAIKKTAH